MNRIFSLFFLLCSCTFTLHSQIPDFYWGQSIGGPGTNWGWDIQIDASGNSYVTGFYEGDTDFDPSPATAIVPLGSPNTTEGFLAKYDRDGNFVWAFGLTATGAGSYTGGSGYSIALDASGNVLFSGAFMGTVDFDPGPGTSSFTSLGDRDAFIAKYDPDGNLIWARVLGSTGSEYGTGLAVDNGNNVILCGYFGYANLDLDPGAGTAIHVPAGNFDAFLLKLNSSGDYLWSASFGANQYDIPNWVGTGPANEIYLTGFFQNTVDFDPSASTASFSSAGMQDIFISKFDASGNFQWVIPMGSTSNDKGVKVETNSAGEILVFGDFIGTVDFDPSAGTSSVTSASIYGEAFLAKYTSAGALSWVNTFPAISPSTSFSSALAMDINSGDQILISGLLQGTIDFDPTAGVYNLSSQGFSNDIYVAEYDDNGALLDAFTFDGNTTGGERICGLSYDPDPLSGPIFTGVFGDDLDADPSPLTVFNLEPYSSNSENMMLIKFGPQIVLAAPLLSFKANPEGEQVALHWRTDGISGSGRFLLSRSARAADWEALSEMPVIMDRKAYAFTDLDPLSGRSFYRLAVLDPDGKVLGSETVEIFRDQASQSWDFYPNPLTSKVVTVTLSAPAEGAIEILDPAGRILFRQAFRDSEVVHLSLEALPPGLYFLRLAVDGFLGSKKLVIDR
jgi:hypothetical protein